MRSRFLLIRVILLFVASVCHATDPFIVPDVHYEDLPGTWTASLGNIRNTITFDANNTFSGVTSVDGKVTDRYEGQWEIKTPYIGPFELIWRYSKSNSVPTGTVDHDAIEILNKKLLVIWTKNKRRHAYQRLTPPP